MTDEQLALAAQAGDQRAAGDLLASMEGFLVFRCRRFYDEAASSDDLLQESRIGLMKAYRVYDPAANTSFRGFAALVVDRQLMTYMTTARRMKQRLLTYAVREAVGDDGEPLPIFDAIEDPRADVVQLLAARADVATVVDVVTSQLSELERESLLGLLNGESYAETEARILGFDADRPRRAAYSPVKVVDNALTRARRKLTAALEADAAPLGAAA